MSAWKVLLLLYKKKKYLIIFTCTALLKTDEVQNTSVPQPADGAVGLPFRRSGADGGPCSAEWGYTDHIR